MPHPKVKIADNSGNEVGVTSNALDVNIAGGATIDIGDVDMFLDGGTAVLGGAGAVAAGVLRVTLASDDAHFGAVGGGSDNNGTLHEQLTYANVKLNDIETDTGTIATTTGYLLAAIDTTGTAFATSDSGAPAVAVRNDTLANLDGNIADGDYTILQVNASGALYVDIADGGQLDALLDTIKVDTEAIETAVELLDNAISGSEMQVDVVTLPASTNTIEIVGDAAEDAAVAGNPVLVGGRYDSSPRSLDNGDVGAIALSTEGYVGIDWTGGTLISTAVISAVQNSYGVTDRNFQVAPAIRNDTLAALGNSTDGDWTPLQVNASGALYVEVASSATLSVNSHAVTNAGTFAVQSTLQTGSAAIGKLAANSGVDIGDVDVTSISAGTNIIGKVSHDITGLVSDGNSTITNSTGGEQLNGATDGSYDQACKRVDLQADFLNTSWIYVGDNGVAINGSGGGIRLYAGDFYSIDIDNVGDIYVVANVDGENVSHIYYT